MRLCMMMMVLLFGTLSTRAQWGCPDPQATNYSASATQNDGSCLYNNTAYTLPLRDTLDTLLREVSGMIYRNGKLYAHNDSGSPNVLYEVDTATGAITKTLILGTKTNVDWEDITQNGTHIFVGDFGNNLGNRQNLVIYKFPATWLTQAGTTVTIPDAQIESLHFSYPDQTSFSNNASTRFDCEAMAWRSNALHLFSKNHSGGACYHYKLPDTAGTFVATLLDSLNTQQYEITAADFASNKQLMLMGYQTTGLAYCAFWYIYDFSSADSCFKTGNKRRIDLGSAILNGQVEALCFSDTSGGFVSNERFVYTNPPVDVPNQLYRFSTKAWYPYVYPNGVSEVVFSEPGYNLHEREIQLMQPGVLQVYSMSGQLLERISEGKRDLNLPAGTYIFQWQARGKAPVSEKKVLR